MAHIHGEFGRARYKGYCAIGNVMDFAACTLPAGFASKDDLVDQSDTVDGYGNEIPGPTGEKDRLIRSNYAKNFEEYWGQPVVLQVASRRWEEERVLAVSQVLEDLIQLE